MNKVKVSICGKEYSIQTSESAAYVYGLARNLEKKLNDFTDTNKSASMFTASVLVGLSCLDDLSKANERYDSLVEKSKEYVDEAGKSRIARDNAIKENEDLKRKIDKLEKDLETLKKTEKSK
jgi:cell division protein ZapA